MENSLQLPLQITFRHMDSSDAVAAQIRERSESSNAFLTGSYRAVSLSNANTPRQQGSLFRVRVDLKVPGGEIVVGRDLEAHHAHEDVYVAIATRSTQRAGCSKITFARSARRRQAARGARERRRDLALDPAPHLRRSRSHLFNGQRETGHRGAPFRSGVPELFYSYAKPTCSLMHINRQRPQNRACLADLK